MGRPRCAGVVPVTMKMGDGTEYETHLVKGCKCTAENTKVSPNGKWIATKYCEDSVSDDGISMYTSETPAFYNTETETTVIVNDYGSGSGTHVTDDGIASSDSVRWASPHVWFTT